MALAESLLAVLACPKSKQPLVYFPRGDDGDGAGEDAGFLLCPASRLRYRIEAGVPVLLIDEAQEVEPGELDRLLDRARALGLQVP